MFAKSGEGSTSRLLQLCAGYFFSYVATGVIVKYFLGPASAGFPGMRDMEFLVYNTIGATSVCLTVVIAKGWYKLQSVRPITWGGVTFPSEYLYIIPSGVCTAIVIPTTTLLYSIEGISVMVAMVIMRGAVIIIGRVVDALQIKQGILKKRVYFEENVAVLFALSAVAVILLWEKKLGFGSAAAIVILTSYIVAYLIRIYIMNYYKNTRPPGTKLDNNGFFGVEQLAASGAMLLFALFFYASPGWDVPQIATFKSAIDQPNAMWYLAMLAGLAYGLVAFFSVFIFMFKGRTATFAGLVNRLTSLVAGTAATLTSYVFFGGKLPQERDWISLGLILVAVGFLSIAEKKRAQELAVAPANTSGAPAKNAVAV